MFDKLNFEQLFNYVLERNGPPNKPTDGVFGMGHSLQWHNPFVCQHMRDGKQIGIHSGWNGVVTEGKNHALDVIFGNSTPVTQIDPWYIGLIDQSPTPNLLDTDVLSSHSGWNEFTNYSGNRQAWDDANAASGVKGTTSVSSFTMGTIVGTENIHGIMICSVATTNTGILWATGAFNSSVPVVTSDVLKITYSVRA